MRSALLSFLLSVGLTVCAQDKIDTDRPDQTESVVNTPKKYFQAEFGFGKENLREGDYDLIHPTFLFKYGLSKRVELRMEGNFLSHYVQLIPNPKTTTALEPVEVGTRITLFEQKSIRPKAALLFHLGLPFTSNEYDRQQKIFSSVKLSFQHTFSDVFAIGYNIGSEWDGYTGKPTWLYTLSPNFNIGQKWYAYVETFGTVYKGSWQPALDTGIAFYTSNVTKVDLSGGIGLGRSVLKNYIAFGFSFRIPTSKKAETK